MIPATLLVRLYAWGIVVVFVAGISVYAHHKGIVTQRAKDAQTIALLQGQIADDAQTLATVNAKAQRAQTEAALQKSYADAAVTYLRKQGAAQAEQTAKWQAKLKAVEQSKGCQTQLESNLCSAVPSY